MPVLRFLLAMLVLHQARHSLRPPLRNRQELALHAFRNGLRHGEVRQHKPTGATELTTELFLVALARRHLLVIGSIFGWGRLRLRRLRCNLHTPGR